jgi:hypothetical protein
MIIGTVKKLCTRCVNPTPTQRKVPFWDLKTVSCGKNSKGMSTKNSRELKLIAAATNNSFPRNPIYYPASLTFGVVSHMKTILHLE